MKNRIAAMPVHKIVTLRLPLSFFSASVAPSTALPVRLRFRVPNLLSASLSVNFSNSQRMDAEQQSQQSQDRRPHSKSGEYDGISERIIPHLLRLYESRATARDFEIYAPDATYEDPLVCAHGVKQIKSAFYALPKLFSESKIVEYTVQEDETGPGKVEILIDNKQRYKIFGKELDLISLIWLKVEEGKIVRHEDWWDKKPPKNSHTENLFLVGRLAELTRKGTMLVAHALMGFGKDPSPELMLTAGTMKKTSEAKLKARKFRGNSYKLKQTVKEADKLIINLESTSRRAQ